MFAHYTVLALRPRAPHASSPMSVYGHLRDYHFARNVTEVKGYLSRCLRRMNPLLFTMPDFILVDAGSRNLDIKTELERWLDEHPQCRRIKVIFPPRPCWLKRWWERCAGVFHPRALKPILESAVAGDFWKNRLVRIAGLEPAQVTPLPPQSSASANSAICATGAVMKQHSL